MTWQLTLASCAAANLKPGLPVDPDPAADAAVEWDASKLATDMTLSNANRDVQNTGANNLNGITFATKPIRPSAGRVYYEILLSAIGAGTNNHQFGAISNVASEFNSTGTSGISGQIGFGFEVRDGSPNSTIRRGNLQQASGLAGVRTAGDTVQFIIDAAKGEFWFGVNNVWQNGGNPTTGVPSGYIQPGLIWYPAVNARDNGDLFRLQSIASHFTYPIPSGCKAYGSDLVSFYEHELPLKNIGFANDVSTGWTVEAGGSTIAVDSHAGNFDTQGRAVFTPFYSIASVLHYYPRPSQNTFTYGGIWQEHTFDSRFNALIDSNQMVIDISMFVNQSQLLSFTPSCNVGVAFFDASDVQIGATQISSGFKGALGGFIRRGATFDIPANTRKMRIIYRIGRLTGGLGGDVYFNVSGFKANMRRRVNLLRTAATGGAHIILGKQPDRVGVRFSALHIILTP